ncbi:MAG: type II toxin-antitoxin system VapC family toxin [Hyphomonadaceae bacterium]
MFLLDTNVVSELRRPARADVHVRSWAENTPAELYAVSVVTIQELERGTLLMERRDAAHGAVLRRWLEEEVLARLASRILPIEVGVARRCAQLHVPNPRPERDALIAATAIVHGLTVVTRNITDFEPMGVGVLNPWTPQS